MRNEDELRFRVNCIEHTLERNANPVFGGYGNHARSEPLEFMALV